MALGGVLAALAVTIMCFGGLIPVATYVVPMLCGLLCAVVYRTCGSKTAWAWYGAVSILGLLLGPDKEAAAVFAALGYYPIVKPRLDRLPLRWLWKVLLFNVATAIAYGLMLFVFGMAQLMAELKELGTVMFCVVLLLGNVTFALFDRVLCRLGRKYG